MSNLEDIIEKAIQEIRNKPVKPAKPKVKKTVAVQSEATKIRLENLKRAREAKKQALEEKRSKIIGEKKGPSKAELVEQIQKQADIITKLQEMEEKRRQMKEEKQKSKEIPKETPKETPLPKETSKEVNIPLPIKPHIDPIEEQLKKSILKF
jgi:hypothetical protein